MYIYSFINIHGYNIPYTPIYKWDYYYLKDMLKVSFYLFHKVGELNVLRAKQCKI